MIAQVTWVNSRARTLFSRSSGSNSVLSLRYLNLNKHVNNFSCAFSSELCAIIDIFINSGYHNKISESGGLSNRNLFCCGSGGWESKIKVPAQLGSSEALVLGVQVVDLLLVLHWPSVCAHGHGVSPFSCKDTSRIGFESHTNAIT